MWTAGLDLHCQGLPSTQQAPANSACASKQKECEDRASKLTDDTESSDQAQWQERKQMSYV